MLGGERRICYGQVSPRVVKWVKIWEMNLARKYTVDFEVYGEKARNPQDAEIDFYIAVN